MDRSCRNGFSPSKKESAALKRPITVKQCMGPYIAKPCDCGHVYPPVPPCCEPCIDFCEKPPCAKPCCPPPACGKAPCRKKSCGHCEQELCDIMASVARVEAALSHILNAEGEKLQKILQVSNDPCEIMKVNDSIIETLASATHLEYVLFEKLRLVKRIRDEECDHPFKDRDECH